MFSGVFTTGTFKNLISTYKLEDAFTINELLKPSTILKIHTILIETLPLELKICRRYNNDALIGFCPKFYSNQIAIL